MKVRDMLHITTTEHPDPKDSAVVRNGIYSFNNAHYGEKPGFFSVILKSTAGVVYGGLTAYVHSDSIFIDILWVDDVVRGQGYGTKLIQAAEAEARKRKIPSSTVDTFDFQAEPFYKKMGYVDIGVIRNYVHGFDRFFLRKDLKI